MALAHRHWIVRLLAYAGTGILVMLAALLIGVVVAFLGWGLFLGPPWLRYAIGTPLLLALLTFLGHNFHRRR